MPTTARSLVSGRILTLWFVLTAERLSTSYLDRFSEGTKS